MSNNQLAILQGVETVVKSITPTNGYLSDLSEIPVIYWQDTDFQYKQKSICIRDYREDVTKSNLSLENNLSVHVEIIEPAEQFDLRVISTQIATDLKQAFNLPSFGGDLAGIHITTKLVSLEKKVETKGIKVLKISAFLNIKYREEIKNG